MTTSKVPWAAIGTPDDGYNVRHITAPGAVTLCWGKDVEGQCLFIVELAGTHTTQFRKHYTTVHGINVDLRQLRDTGRQGLVLTLEKHVDQDLFYGLCQTLVANLENVTEPVAALAVTLNHIKRWKSFMAGKRMRVLTPEEIRGLFAELTFYRQLKDEHLSEAAALEAWCGPERSHQDFVFGDTAVEVKSITGRDRSIVRISSEDQLESVSQHLFLSVFRLTEAPDSGGALSLNALVDAISKELVESDVIDKYWSKLAECGYVEIREYDSPVFLAGPAKAYRVAGGFPRLARSSLPEGVLNVRYDLKLEKIAPFECSRTEMWSA